MNRTSLDKLINGLGGSANTLILDAPELGFDLSNSELLEYRSRGISLDPKFSKKFWSMLQSILDLQELGPTKFKRNLQKLHHQMLVTKVRSKQEWLFYEQLFDCEPFENLRLLIELAYNT